MPRRLLLLLVVVVLGLAPAARATVVVGIGDQKAESFADARLRGLGLRYARLIVPWEAVAGYYDQLVAACPSCTVVAGDVLDSGSYANWLRRFLAASSTTPKLWGLHDYGDVTYGTTTGVDTVLSLVPGALWVEETGGIVTLRKDPPPAHPTFATTEAGAAAAIDRAFAIAAARPRVTRMYIYEWVAFAGDPFDAGLLRPDGTARPGLMALQRDLAGLKRAAPASLTWTAKWSTAHRRQVVLTARCRTTVVRCAGTVSATLRTRPGAAASATFARLATRRGYATTTAKRTASVRITLSAKAYRRARSAPTRRLLLAVAAARPSAGTSRATLSLARPR